jgi:hypothetical protein
MALGPAWCGLALQRGPTGFDPWTPDACFPSEGIGMTSNEEGLCGTAYTWVLCGNGQGVARENCRTLEYRAKRRLGLYPGDYDICLDDSLCRGRNCFWVSRCVVANWHVRRSWERVALYCSRIDVRLLDLGWLVACGILRTNGVVSEAKT